VDWGIFWSRSLCLSVIMLLRTKFRVNKKIHRPDITERRFLLWRPPAMLNLENCGTLSCDRPWKRNLRLHTKLRCNRMIPGWVIAIKPFSKWRPTAIWNFRNLVFWSFVLCQNVILLYPTKFRVNQLITRWDIAKRQFSIWRPSAILHLQNFSILLSSRPWKHNLHLRTPLFARGPTWLTCF